MNLNNLIDGYINDLLHVYNGNEIIIVNIEIQAVFSCAFETMVTHF